MNKSHFSSKHLTGKQVRKHKHDVTTLACSLEFDLRLWSTAPVTTEWFWNNDLSLGGLPGAHLVGL